MPEQEQILQLGGMTENIIARLSERFTLVKLSDQPDRAAFLAERGVPAEAHDSVLAFTHGHPLALAHDQP